VAAALAALELVQHEPRLIERVAENAQTLRHALAEQGFGIPLGQQTQIVPLIVGESQLAMEVCERALKRGVFAQAIRPPTVPTGSARLRLAAIATHTATELRWAAEQLASAARDAGLEPAAPEPVDTVEIATDAADSAARIYDAELEEPAFRRAA
jgi:glycine C-acetyltransferase/8-amino-7-oxononanoate synthase